MIYFTMYVSVFELHSLIMFETVVPCSTTFRQDMWMQWGKTGLQLNCLFMHGYFGQTPFLSMQNVISVVLHNKQISGQIFWKITDATMS